MMIIQEKNEKYDKNLTKKMETENTLYNPDKITAII